MDIKDVDGHWMTNSCWAYVGLGPVYGDKHTPTQTNSAGHLSFSIPSNVWWWGLYLEGTDNAHKPFCWVMQQSNLLENVNIGIVINKCP